MSDARLMFSDDIFTGKKKETRLGDVLYTREREAENAANISLCVGRCLSSSDADLWCQSVTQFEILHFPFWKDSGKNKDGELLKNIILKKFWITK